jgi:hypothetical protein
LTWQYVGVATRTSQKGIWSRTSEDSRPQHRATLVDNERTFYLYKLIDEPGTERTYTFFKLAMGTYTSGDIADVEFMRMVCFVAETVLMGWLQAYKHEELKWQQYWALTPWTTTTAFLPVNRDPPVTQDLKTPTDNASMTATEMSVTPTCSQSQGG